MKNSVHFLLIIGFPLFFAACATTKSVVPFESQELQPVDLSRWNFARTSIDRVVLDWHLESKAVDETCVILFGEKHEWIFNCPIQLIKESFSVSSDAKAPVYFTPNSLSVPGAEVPYAKVAGSIVAQAQILTPFQQQQRNLNIPPVILIQKLEDLVQHHPGFPKESTTTEEILSIAIHEFFHVIQFTDSRVSPFLDAHLQDASFIDQSDLAQFYASNISYQKAVTAEYELLKTYLEKTEDQNRRSAKRVLKKWLGLREKRISTFSKRFSQGKANRNLKLWDSFWTFVEGSARFVESEFLINPSLRASNQILSDDPSFNNFKATQAGTYKSLPMANRSLGAKYYYAIGSHLALILDIAEPSKWKREAFSDPNWIVGMAEKAVR